MKKASLVAISLASLASLAALACSDTTSGAPSLSSSSGGPEPPPATPPPADAAADTTNDAGTGIDAKPFHDAADAALEALLLQFWDGGRAYLRAERDAASPLSGYWIFAQSLDAIVDSAARTKRFADTIETFYLAQDAIGWSRDYFDDESWMALALTRAFDLTGKQKYLDQAAALFTDIATNAKDTQPGLWWDRPHTQKATASNAGAVVAGVRLAQRTGNAAWLQLAKDVFAWWDDNMVDKTTHAVFDHVAEPAGTIVKYKFTYNEGIMIGACLALYDATKDAKYLAEAHAIAGYMVSAETNGKVLFDGDETHCTGDCAMFKGIGYRYLAALHAVDPRPAYADVLATTEKSLVTVARDPATGLFGIDWTAPPGKLVVESAAGAAMTLSIFASAQGAYGTPVDPLVFEAEEGVLHHLGLEARYAGYQGWGYVAGWNADGQWLDIHPSVAPGAYTMTIRYAAGAGDASRQVYADGQDVVANQAFPGTGAWDTYATVDVAITLTATSTVSVIYAGSKGSKQFLNVDRVTLKKK